MVLSFRKRGGGEEDLPQFTGSWRGRQSTGEGNIGGWARRYLGLWLEGLQNGGGVGEAYLKTRLIMKRKVFRAFKALGGGKRGRGAGLMRGTGFIRKRGASSAGCWRVRS